MAHIKFTKFVMSEFYVRMFGVSHAFKVTKSTITATLKLVNLGDNVTCIVRNCFDSI
jgi:uncharacterized membrane protein